MNLSEQIKSKFPNLVTEAGDLGGDATLHVKKEGIRTLAASLKNDADLQFNMLMDLFAIDYLHWEEKALRFEVVYNLFSLTKNQRLIVKVSVPEDDPTLESVTGVWAAANWFERETWDMMGIVFKGHPDLKRILMYEEFKGHPLRKDYVYNLRQPLIGPMN